MWMALIKQYWQINLFKETPENTPYSSLLLGIVILFFLGITVFQAMLASLEVVISLKSSLFIASALVASYAVYTYFLLTVFHFSNRVIQTLTCLLACHTLLHIVALPMLLFSPMLSASSINLIVGIVYLILTLILTLWQFMVTVHIYKHALAISYLSATLAGFGLLASNILIVSFWR